MLEQALEFVGRFGAPVVFLIVFIDQLGVPLPSPPMLLAFGALAGAGRIDPGLGRLDQRDEDVFERERFGANRFR